MGINDTYWIKKKPTKPGKYWFCKRGDTRIVSVWKYKDKEDLYTNEDGGASLKDPEYDNGMWSNKAISEPEPPIET